MYFIIIYIILCKKTLYIFLWGEKMPRGRPRSRMFRKKPKQPSWLDKMKKFADDPLVRQIGQFAVKHGKGAYHAYKAEKKKQRSITSE
jgi:hypothetical protein